MMGKNLEEYATISKDSWENLGRIRINWKEMQKWGQKSTRIARESPRNLKNPEEFGRILRGNPAGIPQDLSRLQESQRIPQNPDLSQESGQNLGTVPSGSCQNPNDAENPQRILQESWHKGNRFYPKSIERSFKKPPRILKNLSRNAENIAKESKDHRKNPRKNPGRILWGIHQNLSRILQGSHEWCANHRRKNHSIDFIRNELRIFKNRRESWKNPHQFQRDPVRYQKNPPGISAIQTAIHSHESNSERLPSKNPPRIL